ncbi:MAG TPA: hypothetical protein VGA72_03825, partial [Anaerolineales bacterium]
VGSAVRVMMIDGIKPFVSGLATGRPVLSPEAVHEFTERILNPRLRKKEPLTVQAPQQRSASQEAEPAQQEVSRARAIFNASENLKPFDPADFDFAMTDDESPLEIIPPTSQESSSAAPVQQPKPKRQRVLGMTPIQLAIISALALALVCILGSFVYLIFIA